MGRIFKVALLGRPNVGKSTLFNRIIGKRKSLTFGRPGITRDFITETVNFQGKIFELIDTGGFVPDSEEELTLLVKRQVLRAIDESDFLVLLFDGKEGISSIDEEIVRILREMGKDFIIVLNKVDFKKYGEMIPSVYELGVENFFEVSAEHGTGVLVLIEEIARRSNAKEVSVEDTKPFLRVSIVGRPNVGKSTLINALIGKDRIIESPLPGTTRDSIDTEIIVGERKIVLVDTAGIKPRSKTVDAVEKIMSIRSIKSIKKSNIAVLVIDASSGATHNDQQIMRRILDEKRGTVIAANKTDLLQGNAISGAIGEINDTFKFAQFVPVVPISATRKRGLKKLMNSLIEVFDQYVKRVKTSELNREAERFLYSVTIPGSRRPNRAYYITQTGTAPPAFTLFVKDPKRVPESFNRYVSNRIRESFNFHGCPLVIKYRQK
jgi:GTP-binding protein